jgi:hypothetical protein
LGFDENTSFYLQGSELKKKITSFDSLMVINKGNKKLCVDMNKMIKTNLFMGKDEIVFKRCS